MNKRFSKLIVLERFTEKIVKKLKKAAPRFELGIKDLQSSALPLGHAAEKDSIESFKSLKNKKNVYFISYEKLCSTKDYWYQIQKLVNIEKPSYFEFRESKKDIKVNIDSGLKEKAMSLYSGLNDLDLF